MKSSKALLLNLAASGGGQISAIGCRLIQVPFLLTTLGVAQYGQWLVLSSLPSLILLANLGFGTVSANYLAINIAQGDIIAARRNYSTGLALVSALCAALAVLAVLACALVPWAAVVKVPPARSGELQVAVLLLAGSVLLSFPCDLMAGRFRAARVAHRALTLAAIRPWIELMLLIAAVSIKPRFDLLALASFLSSLLYFMAYQKSSRSSLPQITFARADVLSADFGQLLRKGLSFQGLTIGNALLLQGYLVVIQYTLGPAAVAVFGTARTMIMAVLQAMGMINTVTWSEFTLFIGKQDYARAARLHRIGAAICLIFGTVGWLFILVFGVDLYERWTHGKIEMPMKLLFIFSLAIPLSAIYSCSAGIHTACNRHEGLARRFILGALLAVTGCYFGSGWFGIEGAAASLLLVNLISARYAVGEALRLTHDNPKDFFFGMIEESRQLYSSARRQFAPH